MELSLIIPGCNEEENLPLLMEAMHVTLNPVKRPYEDILSMKATWITASDHSGDKN
jgi:hypothetical protein